MGWEAAGAPASNSEGFAIGGCSPGVKNVIAVSPLLGPLAPALLATVSSSSSLAGRLRFPPPISSRRFGGAAPFGTRLPAVPSGGRNQDSALLAKHASSNCGAFTPGPRPYSDPAT